MSVPLRTTAQRPTPSLGPGRCLWGLILASALATGASAESGGTREAMADAMVRMMDAMGMFKDRDSGASRYTSERSTRRTWSPGSGMGNWPGMNPMSMPGQTPWSPTWMGMGGMPGLSSPWSSPWTGMGGMPGLSSPWDPRGWGSQIPGFNQGGFPAYEMPWGGGPPWGPGYEEGPIEGAWESPSGELLLIEGSRYRMYAGESRHLDGQVRIEGDRLFLSNPEHRSAQRFEFYRRDDGLLLRDEGGQLYIYRRVFGR